jgi:hypothetical protein
VTWATQNAALEKQIRILVDIGPGTTYFANATITSPSGTPVYAIKTFGGLSQSVSPERCEASVGGFQFTLCDDASGTVTALLAGATEYKGKRVDVKLGYAGLAEASFTTIFRGNIAGITYKSGVYEVSCADLRRTIKQTIFTAATEASPTSVSATNPLTLLLQILTSTGAGTNGTYDTLAAALGLGIDEDLIDVTEIEAIRDDYFSGQSWAWSVAEPAEAKAWIEAELCKPLGVYLTQNADSLLSVRYVRPPLWAESPTALTDSNIIGVPDVEDSLRDLMNEFLWRYTYTVATDTFASETIDIDADSITAYEQSKRHTIESHASSGLAAAFVTSRNARLFTRYADPYPRYRVRTLWTLNTVEVGSVVSLAHPDMPDHRDGTLSVDEADPLLCEVVEKRLDPQRGVCEFTLQGTPFDYGVKYVSIGASTDTEDYDDATTTQHREHGYISDAGGKVGAADDAGYIIMPG